MSLKHLAQYYNLYLIPLDYDDEEFLDTLIKEIKQYYEYFFLDHHLNKIPRWYTVEGWELKDTFNIEVDDERKFLVTYLTHLQSKGDFRKVNESVGNKDVFLDEAIRARRIK